jgi:hypothetical protein
MWKNNIRSICNVFYNKIIDYIVFIHFWLFMHGLNRVQEIKNNGKLRKAKKIKYLYAELKKQQNIHADKNDMQLSMTRYFQLYNFS